MRTRDDIQKLYAHNKTQRTHTRDYVLRCLCHLEQAPGLLANFLRHSWCQRGLRSDLFQVEGYSMYS